MPFVKAADGTQLFYNDWGQGKPVVLIHGWPLNSAMWEYQAPVLAASGLRVIAYDRRGFGKSDHPWGGYDYDTMAGDLNSVMEALDLQGAALVGFSMGGGEVARYLSRYGSARVAKAVLLSAVTPFLLKTPGHPNGVDQAVFDQMLTGLASDRPNFLATFGKKVFGAGLLNFTVTTEILEWALWMAMSASPKATSDCVRAFSATDFRPDMAAFTMPTLVIHGTADATVPIDVSGRAAAAAIPGARLVEYQGAPHATFFVEKDHFNADLLDFLVV
jgi:pimeloyl-ACP methyl ester carboxylesterase